MRNGWEAHRQSHNTHCKKAACEKSFHEKNQHGCIIYIGLRRRRSLFRRQNYFQRQASRDAALKYNFTSTEISRNPNTRQKENAGERNRTFTPREGQWILSPSRLPIPPHRRHFHKYKSTIQSSKIANQAAQSSQVRQMIQRHNLPSSWGFLW